MTTATVRKARPTTYNGIEMRSRLEARVAAWLDSMEIKWEYEPRAFASGREQYLPDFRLRVYMPLRYGPAVSLYVEVKPTIEAALEAGKRMEVIWASEPDAALACLPADRIESVGLFGFWTQHDWRYAAFVQCPYCGWKTLGVLLAMKRWLDGASEQFLSVCPLCDAETISGLETVQLMPEYGS